MKKILTLLFLTLLGFSLISCDGDSNDAGNNEAPSQSEVENPNQNENPTQNEEPTQSENVTPERSIEVDYTNGVLYVPTERPLRVAQFADAHFGVDNKDWHNNHMDRTLEYMAYVVETSNPDFIVCSGDNIIGTGITNNTTGTHDLTEFVEFMESLQTPWTFMYGNHDAETKVKKDYSSFLLNCIATGKTKYLIYKEDYVEVVDTNYSSSDEGRYGNFTIPVYDIDNKSNLLGAYIFLDAGTYLYDLGAYQTITSGQVNWYAQQIAALDAEYKGEGTVPTIVFSHIQLPEHAIAYNKAYYNKTAGYEFVIRQDEMASNFTDQEVAKQSVLTDSGLFDKMVELKSTKGYFVGHAHDYYFQVKSHGIILGYGPQCGFSKLFEQNDEPRLTYVYNVDSNFNFTTTGVKEQEDLGEGLVVKYFDGTNGDSRYTSTYDDAIGLYTVTVTMKKQWAKVKIYYNNEVISTKDSSYTIAGDYQAVCDTSSLKLYCENDPTVLNYPNAQVATYKFTFNPKTKTLSILAPDPERIDEPGLFIKYTYGEKAEVKTANIATADANGNYIFQVDLAIWRAAKLYYYGELLTQSNTTFTGLYTGTSSADWTMNLYWASDNNLMTSTGGTYIFIYNPTSKTLKIGSTGLLYNVKNAADYNSSTNTYTLSLKPAEGDKLTLDFDAQGLTGDSITITGAFSNANNGVTGNVFYQKDANSNEYYCAGSGTYIVTYNATTKTLNFEYVLQSGLTYETRYNGTQSVDAVEYTATLNANGTYTINFEFSKAWAYIKFTYNGVALTKNNTTITFTGLPGIYIAEDNSSIMCNTTESALRAYVITYDPATNTLTMVAA